MKTLIVIPTYNEAENILVMLRSIFESVGAAHPGVEVLVVDDGSPDGTGQMVLKESQSNPRVHVLSRSGKMGLGSAYVAGFRWGFERKFEQFIQMDADFSHHPRYLATMLKTLKNSDVAVGSRYVEGGGTLNWGLGRKILSRGGSIYSRMILGAPLRDFTGGFIGWSSKVLDSVNIGTLRSDGYSFQIELKYRAFLRGAKITEFPIIFEDRKVGKSKMSQKIIFEALARVWGFRFRARELMELQSTHQMAAK